MSQLQLIGHAPDIDAHGHHTFCPSLSFLHALIFPFFLSCFLTGYHDDLPTGLPTKPNGATYIPPVVRPIGPRPKPPVNVTVKLLHGAVNITWSAPEKSNISIFYYVIEYCNSTIWRRLEDVVLTPKTCHSLLLSLILCCKSFEFCSFSSFFPSVSFISF
ncbi:unnamed protein product [Acanthosepion pharaonis]|uniref:Fibronectin type-III domain-containing protein n=1 Tax=Acanthosepion pharaonis TaxID=158019 RepID=A0A812C1X2_ACAPH|nr:unnamed protein product [Sepia pharaonis]